MCSPYIWLSSVTKICATGCYRRARNRGSLSHVSPRLRSQHPHLVFIVTVPISTIFFHGVAAGEHIHSSYRLGLASPKKKGTQPLWLATIMRYYIQPAARRAGINKKIGWHTFRHTFSTLVKSLGVDAKVVQELLRHASFKTTMDGYTQALEEPKRQAQAALADLIMRTGTAFHA